MTEFKQTDFERNIQILGNRVMLRPVEKKVEGGRIIRMARKAGEKPPTDGDIYVCALGDGYKMATQHQKLKLGQRVHITNMGFTMLYDPAKKPDDLPHMVMHAEDVIAILPILP